MLRKESEDKKSLAELVNYFDWWMKNTTGHPSSDSEELLRWLYLEGAAKYINDYAHFCELAKELATTKKYKTADPVIPESDYNNAVKKAKELEKEHASYKKKAEEKDELSNRYSFHQPKGRIAQSAFTIQYFLDPLHRSAQDRYESDFIKPSDIFKPLGPK